MKFVENWVGRAAKRKVSLYWLTRMGLIELVMIVGPAHRCASRSLFAYRAHECGISHSRMASHHPSVTRLRGFETLAPSYLAVPASETSKSTMIGSEAWFVSTRRDHFGPQTPQTPHTWHAPRRFRSTALEAHLRLVLRRSPSMWEGPGYARNHRNIH